MSLPFSEDFSSLGSFETDAIKLLTRAFTTETFHHRVIVNLEDPFRTAVDVTVVTNRLGARLAFEDVQDAKSAVERFTDQFTFGSSGKIGPVNAFCTLALFRDGFQTENMNTDHPETRWCIDPRLLEKADAVFDDHSFFLVPIEKAGLIRDDKPRLINLLLRENPRLTGLDTVYFMEQTLSFFRHKVHEYKTPSICLATTKVGDAVDIFSDNDPFPRVFIDATGIPNYGLFPVLYGLKPSRDSNEHYYYEPGELYKNVDPVMVRINHTMRMLGLKVFDVDPSSVIDWKTLAVALKLYSEGYEARHEAATRSRKADELAGD